mgnify:CR=1 FL=1
MNRRLFIFLISVLILAVWLWGFAWPEWRVFSSKWEGVKIAKDSLTETKALRERLAALSALYQNKEKAEELERIFFALPQKEDIPGLLVNLEALASKNGLVIKSVGFTEEAKKATAAVVDSGGGASEVSAVVKSLGVNLVLSGDYSSFANFLRSVETSLRLMDVEALSFQQARGNTLGDPLTEASDFSVDLKVYYR